jgi:hypothetical protein
MSDSPAIRRLSPAVPDSLLAGGAAAVVGVVGTAVALATTGHVDGLLAGVVGGTVGLLVGGLSQRGRDVEAAEAPPGVSVERPGRSALQMLASLLVAGAALSLVPGHGAFVYVIFIVVAAGQFLQAARLRRWERRTGRRLLLEDRLWRWRQRYYAATR